MSATAFDGLTAKAAQILMIRHFGPVMAGVSANPTTSVAHDGHIVRYLNNYSALIVTPHGKQVVRSTVPLLVTDLSGGKGPIDLNLRPSGNSIVPARPLAAVSIAQDSRDGVAVGSGGLRVTLQGANKPGAIVNGQDVFFGNVGTDTDAVVAPKIRGVDLSIMLRSRLSPEHFRYQVALPIGTSLRAAQNGAVITRAGLTVARIPAPSAQDAQGTVVPVQMSVVGTDLVLNVQHRQHGFAYPILVDPEINVNILESSEGWKYSEAMSGPSGLLPFPGPYSASAPGSISLPSTEFSSGEGEDIVTGGHGEWTAIPLERTDIASVEFVGVSTSFSDSAGGLYFETAVDATISACEQARSASPYGEDAGSFEIPSKVLFVREAHKLNDCKEGSIIVGMTASGPQEQEFIPEHGGEPTLIHKVHLGGSISVGAILVSEPESKEEEEEGEKTEEQYGLNNPGQPDRQYCFIGKPVNCATGNEVETQTDLSVGGRSNLNLTRTYNSQLAAIQTEHGPFGWGWTASYGAHLRKENRCHGTNCAEERAIVTQDNGSSIIFGRYGSFGSGSEWKPISPLTEATFTQEGSNYIYTLPNQTKLHFNSGGELTTEVDRNGNTLTMKYESKGHLESVSDGTGRSLNFTYNSEGEVETAKDPLGHTVKYTYESGNLISVTQPGETSARWKFKYGGDDEMLSETDARSHTITMEYGSHKRVSSQTDALGRKRKWEYANTEHGIETIVTEPNGSVTSEAFNSMGQPTSVTHAFGTSIEATTTYEYNGSGELTSTTDPDKHKTEYGYDSYGNRTSEKDANGNETKWTYDGTHDVETIILPGGETTTIKRDSHGNPETISRPAPGEKTQITKYHYDSYGDLESTTDPLERTWKYEYDTHGDRTAEVDPEGDKRTWEYNEDGQEIARVSPRGHVKVGEEAKYKTKIERNDRGQLLVSTDPLGHATKYTYDGDGNLETVTDANGHKTKYTYDSDNEQTKVEEAKGNTTEAGYDSNGAVVSQTDGNKHATKYVRNGLERVTEVIDPKERKTVKEYDGAGNLIKVTDALGRLTTYKYDPGNRLTEISYSDGKTHAVEYEYNKDGQATVIKDGSGTTKYLYDQLDRLTEAENGHKEVVKYEYDLANEPIKIAYPNGKSVSRAYDKDGRLEKVTDWLEHTTKFAYDADSDLTATVFPGSTSNEDKYTYNEADQMTEVKMMKSTETLASLVYTRDSDGQLKTTTSKGLPGEEKPTYEYDVNNRLTKAGATTYEYDSANNPTKLGSGTYTYDKANELETGTGFKYTYNEMGQRIKTIPTTGPVTSYGYDQAGNLVSIERPKEGSTEAITDTYGYNGSGLRVSQTISGTTTYLAWNTAEAIPQLFSDGVNSYIYGPNSLPIEQINGEGKILYLHHDQQGSTRMLTGSTGAKEATMTYDAYGNTTGTTGTAKTPLGYDAQYTSSDTGLIYLRARVYDPATAQFLTVDPLVGTTRAPYNYAADSPPNAGDPTGLFEFGAGWSQEVFGNIPGTPITGGGGASGMGWVNPTSGSAGTTGTGAVRGGVGIGAYVSGPVVGYSNANNTGELTGPFTEFCAGASLLFGGQVCVEHGHSESQCGEDKSVTIVTVGPTLGLGVNVGGGKSYTVTPPTVDLDPIPDF